MHTDGTWATFSSSLYSVVAHRFIYLGMHHPFELSTLLTILASSHLVHDPTEHVHNTYGRHVGITASRFSFGCGSTWHSINKLKELGVFKGICQYFEKGAEFEIQIQGREKRGYKRIFIIQERFKNLIVKFNPEQLTCPTTVLLVLSNCHVCIYTSAVPKHLLHNRGKLECTRKQTNPCIYVVMRDPVM